MKNNNQGKSKHQYKDSATFVFIGYLGIFLVVLMTFLGVESCTQSNKEVEDNWDQGECGTILTKQDSLELVEPNAIYYDTLMEYMDMDCGEDILRINQIPYESIPIYSRFTDVPAGTDTIIIVDEILYKVNNNKTAWIPIYPDEYVMWISDNGDTIWE